ncbi:putative aldolase [Escherichia coli]|nr:putative aldolase [Escherichia coli]
MADLDDIKDGKDFRTDQPQKKYPFYPERLRCTGLGNAVTLIADI